MNSLLQVKCVVDSTISEDEFKRDPNIGKYRLEIQPITSAPNVDSYLILLLPYRFIPYRRAIITLQDDLILERVLRSELNARELDYESLIGKAKFKVYPYCQIFKFNLSELNIIRFMDEKKLKQWEKPIRKAIERVI